jgi:V-type H+-transporting ATPase subunit A
MKGKTTRHRVTWIKGPGYYTVEEVLMKVETPKKPDITMMHRWPVRQARPHNGAMKGSKALETGQRVLDTLYPSYLGGTCAIPGAFGNGKTIICQTLSKNSNADYIVYVGCGERGNEMAELLKEFPEITV